MTLHGAEFFLAAKFAFLLYRRKLGIVSPLDILFLSIIYQIIINRHFN